MSVIIEDVLMKYGGVDNQMLNCRSFIIYYIYFRDEIEDIKYKSSKV